jgi:hypothetical protein
MFSKLLVRALAVGALAVACFGSAEAQQCRSIVLPNGTVLTCQVVNGQKVYVDNNGVQYNGTSTGTGTFTVTNTNVNPCQATLNPNAINVTSTVGALGTVTTTLDPTRIAPPTTITSNVIGSDFPATERINFFARATVSSRPGVNYRSIQPVQLFSGNVTTFNPHVNEVFNLQQPVDFEDVNRPGVIAFTLRTLSVTLGAAQK